MIRFSVVLLASVLVTSTVGLSFLPAATVTRQVFINFDGSLTGTQYNLAAGEIDNTSSFRANGSATVSGGMGDVPGDLDPTTENAGNQAGLGTSTGSGFYFDGTSLGSLPAQSWVSELLFTLDVPLQEQPGSQNPDLDPGLNSYAHLLGVQGDTFLRLRDEMPFKHSEFGYWDGTEEESITIDDPTDTGVNHAALVWDAAATSLTGYVNGVAQGTIDREAFDDSSNKRIGYGFFARFYNRAFNGKLDAVAFSTFEGTFDDNSDFQLSIPGETVPGDFDMNGDVDGQDFLLWQRDQNVGDLSDWKNNYGMSGVSAVAISIPEPGSAMFLLWSLIAWCPTARSVSRAKI